jgi:hypothetical protein
MAVVLTESAARHSESLLHRRGYGLGLHLGTKNQDAVVFLCGR